MIISNRKENINNKKINKNNNNMFKIGKTNHFNSIGLLQF